MTDKQTITFGLLGLLLQPKTFSVETVQTALRDAFSSLSSSSYLTIPSLPQLPSIIIGKKETENTNTQVEVEIEVASEKESSECEEKIDDDDIIDEDESQRLNFLRTNCDRLTERRATDFSQVNNLNISRGTCLEVIKVVTVFHSVTDPARESFLVKLVNF